MVNEQRIRYRDKKNLLWSKVNVVIPFPLSLFQEKRVASEGWWLVSVVDVRTS